MLHISNVATEAAGETSVRATRPRDGQTIPRGSYDFGDGDMIAARACVTIQPMPIARAITVNPGAVPPDSLPGGGLPSDSVQMPTGQMRGLGAHLMPVPHAFRHGVAPASKRAIVGGEREIRRVGGSLMPMAPYATDVERDPITKDRMPVLNRSATTGAMVTRALSPDDKIRQRMMPHAMQANMISRPAAMTVVRQQARAATAARPAMVARAAPATARAVTAVRPQHALVRAATARAAARCPAGCVHGLGLGDAASQSSGASPAMVGAGLLALLGGVYWLSQKEA